MANKDRQKRSARKARAAERKELEERRAASVPADEKKAKAIAKAEAKKAEVKKAEGKKAEGKKPGKVRAWFGDVKSEMKRVTWPSKADLKNYSVAVIAMLIVFGVAVWLVDTGVVSLLVGYSGLRG